MAEPEKAHTMASHFEPIAIIGAACRLPGEASSLDGLWNMMRNSRSAHARVPEDRWDADAFYHPDPDRKGTLTTTHGFFLEQDVATFDAPFFSVTPKEASGMDPAKRLLLEVAYEAFENAGLSLDGIAGTQTGVYVGSMTSDYEVLSTRDMLDAPYMAAAGSSEAMTANRVSWFFDLRGPSLTLDTACSSSLYALHLACQSLRLRETNMSLVAGVNVILHPNFMNQLTAMHMLSPDGTSHSFDDRANGYGRGEGIGGLIVKRLSDAIRDGDTIRAVIRGTGANVDGKTPSVTMPSSEAQAALIRDTYAEACLPLHHTRYVELHGTGTPVGDPIELSAISSTFGASTSPEDPIYVGSIKPNVGHTEGCAGLAGVFKAVLCLESGVILPTANIATVNPKLRFADWNLALPKGVIPWPTRGLRRISVNSFGFGGANAHVILDDARSYLEDHRITGKHSTRETSQDLIAETRNYTNGLTHINGNGNGVHTNGNGVNTNGNHVVHINGNGIVPANGIDAKDIPSPKRLFVFSSSDEKGIQRIAKSYEAFYGLKRDSFTHNEALEYIPQLAYTLATRRSKFDHRSFAIADSIDELIQQFSGGTPRFKRPSREYGIALVYTGQGAQWAGMGKELLSHPIFAASIARSQSCLATLDCPFNVSEELKDTKSKRMDSAEYSQPICTAMQVGLTDLLAHWGVRPKAVVGHSSGEIAAAYSAGIITHEDAIKVAYLRGVYSGQVAKRACTGAMMAAGISEDEAREYLQKVPPESVVAACINSPGSVTLSGDANYVDELENLISSDGKFARKLRVKTAYHSPHMRTVADSCLKAMEEAAVGEPMTTQVQMFSSVTGDLISHHEIGKAYWIRNMCQPVLFSHAARKLLTYGSGRKSVQNVKWNSMVEVGPHSALKAPLTQIMNSVKDKLSAELPYTSMLVRGSDAEGSSLHAAGVLWALGNRLDLSRVNRELESKRSLKCLSDLPAYPWNHERRYWHETPGTKDHRLGNSQRTDLLGVAVENQNPFEPQWRNFLRLSENPWILDHKITGTTLYPGAGMLIMVLEAVPKLVSDSANIKGVEFADVHFERGLVIPDEGAAETILSVRTPDSQPGSYSFAVYSRTGDLAWTKHCFGQFFIILEKEPSAIRDLAPEDWNALVEEYRALKSTLSETHDTAKLYSQLHDIGMEYGPTFQNLESLHVSSKPRSCFGTITVPDTASTMPHEFEYSHLIHPATLDAIFHLIVVAVADGVIMSEAAVPYRLAKLFVSSQLPNTPGAVFSGYSTGQKTEDGKLVADLVVSDSSWSEPKIVVQGLEMKQVTSGTTGGPITQSSENTVAKRTAVLNWDIDPDFLLRRNYAQTHSISIPGRIRTLRDWLDIECHRTANLRVLVIGSSLRKDAVHCLKPLLEETKTYRGFSQCTFTDVTDVELRFWKLHLANARVPVSYELWNPGEDGQTDITSQHFDLIIAGSVSRDKEPFISLSSIWKPMMHDHTRLLSLRNKVCDRVQVNGNGINTTSDDFSTQNINLQDEILTVISNPWPSATIPSDVYLLEPVQAAGDADVVKLGEHIQRQLSELGVAVHKSTLKDSSEMTGKCVVSLLGLDGSLLGKWNPEEFIQFQDLISSAAHLLWISQGCHALEPSASTIDAGATPGLLRVLRNEYPQIRIAHLDIAPTTAVAGQDAASLSVEVLLASLDQSDEIPDLEFAEVDGHLLVPRVVDYPSMNEEVALTMELAPPALSRLDAVGRVSLSKSSNQSHDMIWKQESESNQSLDPHELELKITEISMDVDQPMPDSLTAKYVTGKVTRLGSSVTSFAIGDQVVSYGSSQCKTFMRVNDSLTLKIPSSIPAEGSAITIWLSSMALYVLKDLLNIQADETIFLQNGATSFGQVLLCLSLHLGAKVFTTVRTQEEKANLLGRFSIDDASILDESSDSMLSYLMRQTNGCGLDAAVVYGPSTSLNPDRFGKCLAPFGRIAAVLNDSNTTQFSSLSGIPNISFHTVNTAHILSRRPNLVSKLLNDTSETLQKVTTMAIHPRTDFSVTDMPEALAWSTKLDSGGIATVRFERDAMIPLMPSKPLPLVLDADAAYVLAGGLGSLGLRIANLMVASGARHLVFLSRSGSTRLGQQLEELRNRGCRVDLLKCDVTSLSDVHVAAEEVKKQGKKIKGVIQCAMVLQDSLFARMSHKQWMTAFNPKVSGTWNLHAALPKDVDFFIMLSSVVAVMGNVSQSNYAAGNTYMDAFAHYRRSLGLSAVSINAGLVSDSDHTIAGTEMKDYLDRFSHMAAVSTTLEELDIGITAALRGYTTDGSEVPPQLVFGINDMLRREGPVVDQWARDAKFNHRVALKADTTLDEQVDAGPNVSELLQAAASLAEAAQLVQDILKRLLAPGLGVQTSDINPERPLYDMGVDSFKAVEIRNQVFRELKSDISVFEILSPSTLSHLSHVIASRSSLVPTEMRANGD
ncbi:lovastatin nonaketide synthase [Nemania sp. FL0916]|nr:lovastatin nonaketide synthase [Nemania sp. FL0916]